MSKYHRMDDVDAVIRLLIAEQHHYPYSVSEYLIVNMSGINRRDSSVRNPVRGVG